MSKELVKILKKIRELIDFNDTETLKKTINTLEPYVLSDVIEVLEPETQVVVFRLLEKDKALTVFEYIEVEVQQDLLQNFTDERAIEFFNGLEPDDRVKLMDELPAKVTDKLMQSLSKNEKELTSMLLGFNPGTAGYVMTPRYVRFKKGTLVKNAMKDLKEIGKKHETLYNLYITDESRILEGVLSLKELITADEDAKLGDVMTTDVTKVKSTDKDEDVAKLLQDSDLVTVPVVDMENRIIGVVTIDDAVDVLEDEARDQALNKAGFAGASIETNRSKLLTQGTLPQVWRIRVPYLMLALVGGLIAGGAISQFEAQLEQIAALAFFIPVIMDMGGNVGTQSSTIFTRALIFGHIDFTRFIKQWLREITIGLSMGLLSGFIAGIIVYVWQGMIELSVVIGIALTFTITIASAIGFLVPAILSKLGFDQAAGSDPFITTIKDITGLLIYFFLATAILF